MSGEGDKAGTWVAQITSQCKRHFINVTASYKTCTEDTRRTTEYRCPLYTDSTSTYFFVSASRICLSFLSIKHLTASNLWDSVRKALLLLLFHKSVLRASHTFNLSIRSMTILQESQLVSERSRLGESNLFALVVDWLMPGSTLVRLERHYILGPFVLVTSGAGGGVIKTHLLTSLEAQVICVKPRKFWKV